MPVKNAFKSIEGAKSVIPPQGVSVLIYTPHPVGEVSKYFGSMLTLGLVPFSKVEGYLSVKVKSQGKTYIVCCGFLVGTNRCNKLGIQIVGEGKRGSHGVDDNGRVVDVTKLASKVLRYRYIFHSKAQYLSK